jgi:hypothetical protein
LEEAENPEKSRQFLKSNKMSRLLLGSINLTELSQKAKSGEIEVFTSEKTGVKYVNVAIFVNDTPDQYGNIASLSHRNKNLKTTYLGNFKESNNAGGGNNAPQVNKDDLDFLND